MLQVEQTFAQGDRQLEDAMDEGRRQMVEATIQKMTEYGCVGTAGIGAHSTAVAAA